ncbi:Exocyst complex component Sec6 [Rhizoctonia solani]|uniref:Exocyst complex component Sec6 n=1 Tax=Rhizoctonia solani TaxID=456999 RepID=A0A8H7M6R8_9AGAM|nr:Exocyst complex component Sec6 [Rhizoctonia solani]
MQSAAQAVGEVLQSPDDLLKIAAFRNKLEKEKASIDAKLKSGVREQLAATADGIQKLHHTRNTLQGIKDEMSSINRKCSDPRNEVPTFDQISRVSVVHRNFSQTEEMVNNLLSMHAKIDLVEEMLMVDRQDILGPAPNLLAVHYQLNQLEAFRNQTTHQAKSADADARKTLGRHFERLNRLSKAFDEYIFELGSNVLPIVRNRNPGVIVRLIKICEIEGREDEKAIAIKLVKKAANLDAASKFKSMLANARVFKHYRSEVMKRIRQSIQQGFAEKQQAEQGDTIAYIDALSNWMLVDLIQVFDEVVPCFPQDYEIWALFVKNYHKFLDESIQAIVASNPEASVILRLYAFVKREYKQHLKKLQAELEIEIPPEWLQPPLLGGKEQELIDDYVKLIVSRLDTLTTNLMTSEIEEFTRREQPPEIDPEGLYGMKGPVDFFQMVNQYTDAAVESGQGAVLASVVGESARVMTGLQAQWTKLLESEHRRLVEKPEEAPGGFAEYVIALANDQIKSANYAETLSTRLEERVSEKYAKMIAEKLDDAINGYLDVAKKCTQVLIELIFNDLKPATKKLFAAPIDDYQNYLNPSIFEILVEDLIDTFLSTYLTALRRTTKLRMPAAGDRLREDIADAFDLFKTYKSSQELDANFDVMDQVLSLLTASQGMVFLSFWPFAQQHGPNLAFVEALMKARDDLDRSAVSEIMESCRRKVKDEQLTDPSLMFALSPAEKPTIMKKVAAQSVLAMFLQR